MESQTTNISIEHWQRLVEEGGAPTVKISLAGSSMQPLIRKHKDFVTIAPLSRSLIRGDMVLFRAVDGRYVVHRVWKLEGNRVRTIGDNCSSPDSWITKESVFGLVIKMERDGHDWQLDTTGFRLLGRAWMTLFPVRQIYFIIRHEAGNIIRRWRKRKNENTR